MTPQIRSPSAWALLRSLSTTSPHPSPQTKPSAEVSNVQHWPVGDSIPALARNSQECPDRTIWTPPAIARSVSFRCNPATAW